MQNLTIIRGVSGSGKSTHAKKLMGTTENCIFLETDMFFYDNTGEYNFNKSLIGYAHQWCAGNVARSLHLGYNVIVANTFTQMWEMSKYLDLKNIFPELEICVVELKTQFANIHGVPPDRIAVMHRRWEEISPEHMKKIDNFIQITE